MPRGVKGAKLCRYEYDSWIGDDGRLYVKGTGVEYERATADSFDLGIRRKMRAELERIGAGRDFARGVGNMEVWDVARNIADDLPEAYTYRTTRPLPQHVLAERDLATSA